MQTDEVTFLDLIELMNMKDTIRAVTDACPETLSHAEMSVLMLALLNTYGMEPRHFATVFAYHIPFLSTLYMHERQKVN